MPTHEHDDDLQRAYAAFIAAASTSIAQETLEPAATAYRTFAIAVHGVDAGNNPIDQRVGDLMGTITSGLWDDAADLLASLRRGPWTL